MNCSICHNPISHGSQKGRCLPCYRQRGRKILPCLDCGKARHSTYKRCFECHLAFNESQKCNESGCDNNRHRTQSKCKECYRLFGRRHRHYHTDYKLKTRYNITIEDQKEMLRRQNNSCAACKIAFKNGLDTHLDHCHRTGKIRGLLCRRCNTALGIVHDSASRLHLLIDYLESESSETTRFAPSMKGDDIVRPLWRHRECDRNDRITSDALLNI